MSELHCIVRGNGAMTTIADHLYFNFLSSQFVPGLMHQFVFSLRLIDFFPLQFKNLKRASGVMNWCLKNCCYTSMWVPSFDGIPYFSLPCPTPTCFQPPPLGKRAFFLNQKFYAYLFSPSACAPPRPCPAPNPRVIELFCHQGGWQGGGEVAGILIVCSSFFPPIPVLVEQYKCLFTEW